MEMPLNSLKHVVLERFRSFWLNWRFTSATISPAALPTDFMVRAANQ